VLIPFCEIFDRKKEDIIKHMEQEQSMYQRAKSELDDMESILKSGKEKHKSRRERATIMRKKVCNNNML
jgi:hypothetical protein